MEHTMKMEVRHIKTLSTQDMSILVGPTHMLCGQAAPII